MKKNLHFFLSIICLFVVTSIFANNDKTNFKENFTIGDPGIQSMNAIDFGPESILFVGDSKTASVVAIDLGEDPIEASNEVRVQMEQVDKKIAALMGTTAENITVQDMAVNPASQSIYFAVHSQDGTPALFRTKGRALEHIPLKSISHSIIALEKAVAEDAKDRRGRALRKWAISDLAYEDGKVMVSGLSNEEFSSTFRSIPFPFKGEQMHASLEIYHAAHGRYETYAPIKTFMPYELNGKQHLIASYTCTPLVVVPMDELQPGKHTKGKTVAELGNRNTPLDIISYEKEGKPYLLLANSHRALMKIDPTNIEKYEDFLTERIAERGGTEGIHFINLPYVNVQQMDRIGQDVLVLQRMNNGDLNLHTINKSRL